MTLLRSGFAANASGPSFLMPAGAERNPAFTDEFLVEYGAAPFSSIIMTPSGFLTDESWKQIVPLLIKGLRHKIREAAAKLGIDAETADKLKMGLFFDGFKSHVKNLVELVEFVDNNILTCVECRDSTTTCRK